MLLPLGLLVTAACQRYSVLRLGTMHWADPFSSSTLLNYVFFSVAPPSLMLFHTNWERLTRKQGAPPQNTAEAMAVDAPSSWRILGSCSRQGRHFSALLSASIDSSPFSQQSPNHLCQRLYPQLVVKECSRSSRQ